MANAEHLRHLLDGTWAEWRRDNPRLLPDLVEAELRGRVGRGRRRSLSVLLLGERPGAEALARLEAFAATTDGFAIAEQDFRLRGPGEFTGLRQWGRPEFRVAQLWRHREELEAARAVAAAAAARGELERLSRALAPAGVEDRRVPVG